jgi:AraC-like DNA-binding protein
MEKLSGKVVADLDAAGGGGGQELSMQRHYTPKELAKRFHVSDQTIRRWFKNEPGVITWGYKRHLLRIPEAVVIRVHRRMRERCTH